MAAKLKNRQAAVVDNITMLQYFGRHVLAAPEVSVPLESRSMTHLTRNISSRTFTPTSEHALSARSSRLNTFLTVLFLPSPNRLEPSVDTCSSD